MDLDGQAIERRDFPISRRGYEPAAVDAHLRAVSAAVGALRSEASRGETLGQSAGSQVQGILDAAQSAAAKIVHDAEARAAEELRQAQAAAAQVRSDALAKANAHVAAVSETSATLRRRLEAMEGEIGALTSSLQEGSARLTQDLAAVREEMASLYDAAAGRRPATAGPGAETGAAAPAPAGNGAALSAAQVELDVADVDEGEAPEVAGPVGSEPQPASLGSALAAGPGSAPAAGPGSVPAAGPGSVPAAGPGSVPATSPAQPAGQRSSDVDGARLIALNMALNGDSREQTDRYLAEHFDLPERAKLVDEVYAAIDG